MDKLPQVVEKVYERAITNSPKDAGLFIDLISKNLNIEKQRVTIMPIVITNISPDEAAPLFTPDGYEKFEDITPGK